MNKTSSRVLWAVAGALLILAGVVCFVRPGVALATIAAYLGIMMLLFGLVDIVIFAKCHDFMCGAGWFLVDGILTVLLSLFILFNESFTALTLPILFGMWLLFSGVSKIVSSFDLKKLGIPGWGLFLALGIAFAVVGFLSFANPVAGAVTIGSIVGFVLILQGVGSILRAVYTDRFWIL